MTRRLVMAYAVVREQPTKKVVSEGIISKDEAQARLEAAEDDEPNHMFSIIDYLEGERDEKLRPYSLCERRTSTTVD